jgi:hypothetical protein
MQQTLAACLMRTAGLIDGARWMLRPCQSSLDLSYSMHDRASSGCTIALIRRLSVYQADGRCLAIAQANEGLASVHASWMSFACQATAVGDTVKATSRRTSAMEEQSTSGQLMM